MLVYVITNTINNKRYIGQTVQKLEARWKRHTYPSRNMAISRAIKKHGSEHFNIRVLARCVSIEEMNHREAYYIKLFNTLCPNGYNLDSGGKNKITHQSTKDKLSKIHKGRIGKPLSTKTKERLALINTGKKHSEETKAKMGKSRSGNKNPNYGGRSITQYQRCALRARNIGRPSPRRRPVLCVTTGVSYPYLMKAAEILGINFRLIAKVCSGERPQTHGMIFKYL
jgi:group I intron endonuclease